MRRILTVYVGSIEESVDWWTNKVGANKIFQGLDLGVVEYGDTTLIFRFWPDDPLQEVEEQSANIWDSIIAESDMTIEEFYDKDNKDDDDDPRAA